MSSNDSCAKIHLLQVHNMLIVIIHRNLFERILCGNEKKLARMYI